MIIPFDDIPLARKIDLLQHCVAPRPIGLISTINAACQANLAPFSFFNVVSTNPPMVVFSPLRKMKDNSLKDTIENIREVPEAVIHIVTHEMIAQVNLTGCSYRGNIDEFRKAGFTKQAARHVRPFLVKESPIKFECRITETKPLGPEGGAGVICLARVICMHVDERLFDANGQIDHTRVQHVGRLGGNWYVRINKSNLFTYEKPDSKLSMGFDNLPEAILNSQVLKTSHLAQLASVEYIPEIEENFKHGELFKQLKKDPSQVRTSVIHSIAVRLLERGQTEKAWQVLIRDEPALQR